MFRPKVVFIAPCTCVYCGMKSVHTSIPNPSLNPVWKTCLFENVPVIRHLMQRAPYCAELIPFSAVTLQLIQYFEQNVWMIQ